MESNVLQEFLVALGFKIEAGGFAQFEKVTKATTAGAMKMGAAVAAAAAAIAAGAAKIAGDLEQIYWSTQLMKEGAANVDAFRYAIAQLGGTAAAGGNALASFAKTLRTNPAMTGFLQSLGVKTTGGPAEQMLSLFDKLRTMKPWQASQIGNMLGIDDATLQAGLRDGRAFYEEQQKIYKQLGIDADGATAKGQKFAQQMRKVEFELGAIKLKVESGLLDKLAPAFKRAGDFITAHLDDIANGLEKLFSVSVALADFFGHILINVLGDVWKNIKQVADGTKGWAAQVLGLVAAWRVLSGAFATSPLGVVLLLASALALLWQDYEVWKNGGKSAIDWKQWDSDIQYVIGLLKTFFGYLDTGLAKIGGWQTVAEGVLAYMAGAWVGGMLSTMGSVVKSIKGVTAALRSMSAATKGGLVALAGFAGFEFGTWLYNQFIAGTKGANVLGRAITKILAFFGDKDAKATLAAQDAYDKAHPEGGAAEAPSAPKPGVLPWGTRLAAKALALVGTPEATHALAVDAAARAGNPTPNSPALAAGPGRKAVGASAGRGQQIIDAFVALGWTREQAAGIAANFSKESGFNEGAQGDFDKKGNARAFGLGQWHPDRQKAFKDFTGVDIHNSTWQQQVAFANYELTKGAEKFAGQKIRETNTGEGAAAAAARYYERPANTAAEMLDRARIATNLLGGAKLGAANTQGGDKNITLNQTTKIEVHGSEPKATAAAVASEQGRVQSDTIRNFTVAVR